MIQSSPLIPQANSLRDLIHDALKSRDGLALPEYINLIASYEGDPDVRASALLRIAEQNPFASHIVVGVISGLALNNLPNSREFARSLINAPMDREKDLILARAYSLLAEHPPIDPQDVPTIVRGSSHPDDCVREATQRAIKFIPMQSAVLLRDEIAKMPRSRSLAELTERLDSDLAYKLDRLPSFEFKDLPETQSKAKKARPTPPEKPRKVVKKVSTQSFRRETPSIRDSRARRATPSSDATTFTEPKPNLSQPLQTLRPPPISPLQTLPEYMSLSPEHLNNICQSASDATRFIYALGELVNRYGTDVAVPHSGRFVFFACQPDYPREIFEQVSGRIFGKR